MKPAILVAVIALLIAMANSSPQPKPTKVGVINMKKCTDDSLFVKDVEDKLKKQQEGYYDELQKMAKEVDVTRQRYEGAPKGSQLKEHEYQQLLLKTTELEAKKKFYATMLSTEWQKYEIEFYNEINKTAQVVAKEKGFDLVIRVGIVPADEKKGDADDLKLLSNKLRYENVVYYSNEIDFTADVAKRLNDDHTKKKAEKPKDK